MSSYYRDENLKGSIIASAILHVGGLLVLYFGVPAIFNKPPPVLPWRPVPVDIVEIGEITNTRIKGPDDNAETARTSPPTQATPAPPEEKPPEPVAKPTPPAEAPKPDDVALPTPQSKPKPPEPPKASDLAKEIEKSKPKPQPQADPLASVLKNVAQIKPSRAPIPDARPGDTRNEGTSKTGTATGSGPALGDRLTISQEDALRRQIGGCWNMPIGARNAQDLIVEVLIEMNEDRTVRSAQIVDQSRLASDPAFRAAAEAAMRALRNPKCSPLELPPDQYEQWKTIRFNFDPRDML